MSENQITIVHTKNAMLLTRKYYADWRAVQGMFTDYVVSLGPFTPMELVDYLNFEYPVDPPFSEDVVRDFLRSERDDLWSEPSTGQCTAAVGAVRRFEQAAIHWAGSGYGKPLVIAAVAALMEGLDTPSLRVLAGASLSSADQEASDIAVEVFRELGLSIAERHSEQSYIDLARLKAQQFLDNNGSARQLASELWNLYKSSNYREELAEFSGLDEWYVMLDDRIVQGDSASVDQAVREAAQELIADQSSGEGK